MRVLLRLKPDARQTLNGFGPDNNASVKSHSAFFPTFKRSDSRLVSLPNLPS